MRMNSRRTSSDIIRTEFRQGKIIREVKRLSGHGKKSCKRCGGSEKLNKPYVKVPFYTGAYKGKRKFKKKILIEISKSTEKKGAKIKGAGKSAGKKVAGEKNYGVKLWAGNYGGEMGGGNMLEKNKAEKNGVEK